MSRITRPAAFSLVELVVATGLAVLLVGAVSGSVVAAQRLEARSQTTGSAVAAAAALWEQLRCLPFCLAGTAASTLTQRVFPHADAALNDADAWFGAQAQNGCPPGTFFSTTEQDGVTLHVAATYCLIGSNGWAALPSDRLSGYSPLSPPSGRLLVRIRAGHDPADLIVGVLSGAQDPTDGAGGLQ